jgi:hypothetical protein
VHSFPYLLPAVAPQAMNKALKPLYAALSATQKQAADQLF